MKNLIVKWSALKDEIKRQVNLMLQDNDPDYITFSFGGKNVQGFIYKTEDTSYLIIPNDYASHSSVSVVEEEDDDGDDGNDDVGADLLDLDEEE